MAKPRKRSQQESEDDASENGVSEDFEGEEEEGLQGAVQTGGGYVEFHEEEAEDGEKALTGRRLKRKKELQKKMKTGTFGKETGLHSVRSSADPQPASCADCPALSL